MYADGLGLYLVVGPSGARRGTTMRHVHGALPPRSFSKQEVVETKATRYALALYSSRGQDACTTVR